MMKSIFRSRTRGKRLAMVSLFVACLFLLMMSSRVVHAEEDQYITEGDYKYRVISEENKTVAFAGYTDAFVEAYTDAELHLVIPEKVLDEYTVTALEDNLFYSWNTWTKKPSEGIVSVTIPKSVTIIGEQAFTYSKKLTTLTIAEDSELREIGEEAFYGTALSALDLPDSVEVIGEAAFRECQLESLTISEQSKLRSIGYRGFYNAGWFDYLYLPASLESMGREAFSGCCRYKNGYYSAGLRNVRIADGTLLKEIPYEAFRGDRFLEQMAIPMGITTIGEEAFSECTGLASVILPSSITTIGDSAFWGCYDEDNANSGLKQVVMGVGPEEGLTIGEQAFDQCENLTVCDPVQYAVSLGEEAFWKADLRQAHLREGLTEIPEDCFYMNENLEELTLPEGLLTIGKDAFSHCDALKEVILPNTLTTLGTTPFYNCDSLTSFHVPASVTSIEPGRGPVGACGSLTRITVDPANPVYDSREDCNCIIRTADNAVICVCQTSVLPASVEIIEEYTFSGTKGLTKLTFGPGTSQLKEVRHAAFAWNDDIEEAIFPDGVVFTGSMHFQQDGKLTTTNIPWGTSEIPSSAYYKCNALTSLTLPSSFAKMTWNPLGNTGLAKVLYEGSQDSWDAVEMDDRSVHWRYQVEFTPGDIPVNSAKFTLPDTPAVYQGSPVTVPVTATYKGIEMVQGRDFTVSYENNNGPGTGTVNIRGIGSFWGDTSVSFTIREAAEKKSIAKATVTGIKDKTYTGSAITQTPTVKLSGKTLKNKTDYKLSYKTNVNVGTATVTITGIGNYTGSVKKTFKIIPKGTVLGTLTPASKGFTVKWKKQLAAMKKTRITGYEIQYSTSSTFKTGNKTVKAKGYKVVSKKITKLKAKKKYYVRIRTYTTIGKTTYYSVWSKKKTVTTK